MTEQRDYRYTAPGPCPDHPSCLVLGCQRWLCERTVHMSLIQRGHPRRYCCPACRVAEHRRLRM